MCVTHGFFFSNDFKDKNMLPILSVNIYSPFCSISDNVTMILSVVFQFSIVTMQIPVLKFV